MIIVAPPTKPFTYTAKGTVRRQAVINDFEPEIDSLYKTIEESSQTDLEPPSSWDEPTVREFLRKAVGSALLGDVTDDDDLFQHGCDR